MGTAADRVYLIWSLTSSGLGTTLTTSGNSGGYTATGVPQRTTVDLRYGWGDDYWLSVFATGGAGTGLVAQLDAYDDQGNLFPAILTATSVASAPGHAVVFGGRHGGGGTGTYFVAPEYGRISWALTGTMTGVEIALYGR